MFLCKPLVPRKLVTPQSPFSFLASGPPSPEREVLQLAFKPWAQKRGLVPLISLGFMIIIGPCKISLLSHLLPFPPFPTSTFLSLPSSALHFKFFNLKMAVANGILLFCVLAFGIYLNGITSYITFFLIFLRSVFSISSLVTM